MTGPDDRRTSGLQGSGIDSLPSGVRDAMVVVEAATGRIVFWNRRASEIFGYPASEALGSNVERLVPDELKARYRNWVARYLETGHDAYVDSDATLELPTVREDGDRIRVEGKLSRLEEIPGEQAHGQLVLAVIRDVALRRNAEEEGGRSVLADELREAKWYAARLRELNEAALAVNAASTVDEVLRTVVVRARELVGAHQSVTRLTTSRDRSQWPTATSYSDKYAAWREREAPSDGPEIMALVRSTNSPIRLTRDELEAQPASRRLAKDARGRPPMRGCLGVPLTGHNGENIGLIQLSDKDEGEFTEADESLLVQLAQIASAALERTLLYQQTRSAIDSLCAHIAILDETGLIIDVNRAWREFAAANAPAGAQGLAEGANYLRVCESAVGPNSEEGPRVAEAIRAIVSGKTQSFELEYPCHSSDEQRWFLARLTRFPETEPPRVVVAHENITERKQAQEEIETRTRQQAVVAELGLRALANNDPQTLMDEAAARVAQTLRVEYCKIVELLPGGEELLLRAGVGWRDGLVGNATEGAGLDSQSGYTLLSGAPVILEDLAREARFEPPPLLREHGVVSGVTVVIYGRGGPFGVLGAHTAGHRAFSKDDVNFLQAVANVLAAAVERQGSEETLREVRQAERDRMARDLHDEALQDLTRALVEARFLQRISRNPEADLRLGRLVEALRRAGRGTHNAIHNLRLEREARERTLAEMLESVVEMNRRTSPDREIELSVEGDPSPPLPGAKQVELLRIIQEALSNALRHSHAGRIRVIVGTRDGILRAEVEDDGRGVDPAQTDAGLGMKGMRERAHAVGGDLAIVSSPGEGTTVRFELALRRGGRQEPGGEEEIRILLVEDHASVRQATASVLEQEPGFRVVGQAGSLSAARSMLDGVDVALVDLGLPDGYGGDLIKDLRKASPRAQAIILSALLDDAEIARAVESGAAGVLEKSSEINEIVDAVRRLQAGETLMPLEKVVELLRLAGSRREEEFEAQRALAQLTSREKEVLQALADGLDSNQVAERLNISVKTETNHITSILNKLGLHSRLQALVFAIRHGVVEVR